MRRRRACSSREARSGLQPQYRVFRSSVTMKGCGIEQRVARYYKSDALLQGPLALRVESRSISRRVCKKGAELHLILR